MSIPNTLNIYINATIPGHQFIKYTPSMSIPNTKSKTVYFDPLIQLKKSVVDNTPKSDVVSQFFDKNLFRTLIYRSSSFQPKRTLKQATSEGIVDDNINITLKTIFKPDNLFYIDKKPYTIFSNDWEKGNWKIDAKIRDQPIPNQAFIQNINNQFIQSELNEAKKELANLPEDVTTGETFQQTEFPITTTPLATATVTPLIKATAIETPLVSAIPLETTTHLKTVTPLVTATELIPYEKPQPQIQPSPIVKPQPQIQNTPLPNKVPTLPPIPVSVSATSEPVKINYESNTVETRIIKEYLSKPEYYYLIRSIYNNLSGTQQRTIIDSLPLYTKEKVDLKKPLTQKIYNSTTSGIHVIKNDGGGNCFYISVSNAINNYNSQQEPQNRIFYKGYGEENKPFTQLTIRTIVATFIKDPKNKNQRDIYQIVGQDNADVMNAKYNKLGSPDISDINNILDGIYSSSDNFYVKRNPAFIKTVQGRITLKGEPFIPLETDTDIDNYFVRQQSWAQGDVTISILQKTIGLTVIPIEKVNRNSRDYLRIAYADLTKQKNTQWAKYMFIYATNGNHFEEIQFDYYLDPANKKDKTYISIFDIQIPDIIPPLYILFLLYASYFFTIGSQIQNSVILPKVFEQINDSYNKIIKKNDEKTRQFTMIFQKYFPHERAERAMNTAIQNTPSPKKTKKMIKGGKSKTKKLRKMGGAIPTAIARPLIPANPFVSNNLEKESNIGYYVVITLNLYPGKEIPLSEKPSLACRSSLNKVKKSWADVFGKIYAQQPYYHYDYGIKPNKEINKEINKGTQKGIQKAGKNKTRKTRKFSTLYSKKQCINYYRK